MNTHNRYYYFNILKHYWNKLFLRLPTFIRFDNIVASK